MAGAPPPTVIAIKQSFLTTQTRLLSQPLAPSRQWQRSNAARGDGNDDNDTITQARSGALPERAVDDALFRLNHVLQQHERRAHPPQATRHVAEQLDRLYWDGGSGAQAATAGGVGGDAGVDYVDSAVIAALPSEWEGAGDADGPDARRYADAVARLRALSARRAELEARTARLRRMRDVLAPFAAPSAGEGAGTEPQQHPVQPNLVTRDGELERELERMRVLLVRVAARVAQLPERGTAGVEDDLFGDREGGEGGEEDDGMVIDDAEVEERQKIDALLQRDFGGGLST